MPSRIERDLFVKKNLSISLAFLFLSSVMQRASATKSSNVDSKHVDIYLFALLYFTLHVAQSTSFFFSSSSTPVYM